MKSYAHLHRAVLDTPWAITQPMLAVILDVVRVRAEGVVLDEETIRERVQAAAASNGPRGGSRRGGPVAIVPVYGPITPRSNLLSATSGGASTDAIASDFRQAMRDPEVASVLLDVDSPGGSVYGIEELASLIRSYRGVKPIVASANHMMASAALWIAAAADEIVASPSAQLGSVGVIAAHEDHSAEDERTGVKRSLIVSSNAPYKAEGNPYEPLSDEARADIQAKADAYSATMTSTIAKYRGVSVDVVRSDFGKGRMLLAREAVSVGMADRVESFDATITRLERGGAVTAARPLTSDSAALADDMTTAALATEPFSARLRLATAEARELAEIARERAERRALDGRKLSTETTEGLEELRAALLETAGDLEQSTRVDDEPTPIATAINRRRMLDLAEARLATMR